MSDKVFAKGIWYNEPLPNAPDYVIGALSIDIIQFKEFLSHYKEERVRLKILKSKENKPYIEVDTWKPKPQGTPIYNKEPEKKLAEIVAEEDDELPF